MRSRQKTKDTVEDEEVVFRETNEQDRKNGEGTFEKTKKTTFQQDQASPQFFDIKNINTTSMRNPAYENYDNLSKFF